MIHIKTCVFSMLLGLFFLNVCHANVNNFSGAWCWTQNNKNHAFEILIKRDSNVYKGSYGSVSEAGNKIDENNDAFSFNASEKTVIRTNLTAGITGNTGIVRLTITNNNKIEWKVVKVPKGEFYVPHKAVLYRC